MKKILFLFVVPCLFSMSLQAQSDTDVVARLSADDYTSFLLGEYTLPEGKHIATLADSTGSTLTEPTVSANHSTGTFIQVPENATLVPLAPAEAQAMAVQIYFKFVEGNVSRLGYPNALRLTMGELGLSQAEATGFIDFATSSVKEFENLLTETNVDNCENFVSRLSTGTVSDAVREMSRAESQLNSIVIQYYDGISSRLDNTLGVSIYDDISPQLGHIASSLKTIRRENVGFDPSEIDSAVTRYNTMCDRFSSLR